MSLHLAAAVVALLLAPTLGHAQDSSMVRVTQATAVVEQPDGNATTVGTANAGQILEVLDQRNGWLLVRPPAGSADAWKTGWVNAASTQPMQGDGPAVATAAPAQSDVGTRPPGARKGFIIGLGGGIGLHRYTTPSFTIRNVTFGGETLNSSGLATEFLIGYAPTDRLLVYYENSLQLTGDLTYDFLGLTGGGATYFFNPRARSWYVKGAIGAAVGAEVDTNRNTVGTVDRGIAYSIGGGYEFARHWLLGAEAMFLKLDNVTHTAVRGTITWVFY